MIVTKKQKLFLSIVFSMTIFSNTKIAFAKDLKTYSINHKNDDSKLLSDYLSNLNRYSKEIEKKPNAFVWKKVPFELLNAYFWIRENQSELDFQVLADKWINLAKKVNDKELKPYSKITNILAQLIRQDFKQINTFTLSSNSNYEITFLNNVVKVLVGESKKVQAYLEGHKYSIAYDTHVLSEKNVLELQKKYTDNSLVNYILAMLVYQKELEFSGKEEKEFDYKEITKLIHKICELDPNNYLYQVKKLEWSYSSNESDKFEQLFQDLLLKAGNETYLAEEVASFYAKKGLIDNSIKYLNIALNNDGKRVGLYKKLNSLYSYSNKLASAIELYEKALKKLPNNIDFYDDLADLYIKNKEPNQKIIDLFTEGVKNNPNESILYVDLGDSFYNNKNLEKAIENYNKALELNKNNIEAYGKLISLYFDKNDNDKAIIYSKKAVEDNPNYFSAYLWLGSTYVKTKNLDSAIDSFKEALKLSPNNPNCYNSLALAYVEKNEYDLAIEYFSKALDISPNNNQTLVYIADAYAKKGSLEKAENIYNQALKNEPYNDNIYLARGNFFSENKKYDLAQADLEKAILLNTQSLDARNNLGNLYIKQKKYDLAIDNFEMIIKMNSKYSTAYYNLACIYSLKEDETTSLKYLAQSISLDKTLKEVAKKDTDFDYVKETAKFKELIE